MLLQKLLDAVDYLGVSGYGSGYPTQRIAWTHMERALETLAHELSFFGVSLKQYMFQRGLPTLYVEQVSSVTATSA